MAEIDTGDISGSSRVPFWERDLSSFMRHNGAEPSGKARRGRRWVAPWTVWNSQMFANGMVRREAKSLLFSELAEAARQGMPLELALQFTVRRTDEIYASLQNPHRIKGADNRLKKYSVFLTLLYIFTSNIVGLYLLLLGSAWSASIERVARIQARRLLPWIEMGYSFSEAMRKCGSDFSLQEIAMVESGETLNRLPLALQNMARYHLFETRVQKFFGRLTYPVFLIFFLIPVVSFILVFIIPKFKDIFDQLGAQLPDLTDKIIHVGYLAVGWFPGMILFSFVLMIMGLFMVRCAMNGNRILRNFLAVLLTLNATFLILQIGLLLLAITGVGNFLYSDSAGALFGFTLLLSPLVLILVTPYLMRFLEVLILKMEGLARRLFGRLPIVGTVMKQESRSRWLASLAMSLEAGMTEPDAMRIAGRVAGGSLARNSEMAADLVAQGQPLAKACEMAKLLPPRWTTRFALLDGNPDFLNRLADIANDANDQSYEVLNRASRVAEIVSVVFVAVIIGLFVVAVYLPLLRISLLEGLK